MDFEKTPRTVAECHSGGCEDPILSQFFRIHPKNPQQRLLHQAVEIIRSGGTIVYPTDSCYALGCQIGDMAALKNVRAIRKLSENHVFTLVFPDLSQIAEYAVVENGSYRLMKNCTPGPFTFVLEATRKTPRRLLDPKRKAIGIRVPDNAIATMLLLELGEPLVSTSLILPGRDGPLADPEQIRALLEKHVDLVLSGGPTPNGVTTVVDLTAETPRVLRAGLGNSRVFGDSGSSDDG